MLTVRDHMLRQIPTLTVDMSLPQALDRVIDSALGGLPVVDGERRLVGFLSERDCLPSLLSSSYHCDLRTRVGDLMSQVPLSVAPDESILTLAERMSAPGPRLYPVVDQGRLIGAIGRRQVTAALNQELKQCQPT